MLFIVSTPIGNIKDVSLRALEVLSSVNTIICEDTRITGQLLSRYNKLGLIKSEQKPTLISFHEHNEQIRLPQIISLLHKTDIALVSSAGTPTISDPGFKLIRTCHQNNIAVVSIPGPTALISALSTSGKPTDKFLFLGFLPKKELKKEKLLSNAKQVRDLKPFSHLTFIAYESPHKLLKTLFIINKVFGNIDLAIASELTKKFEKTHLDTLENHLKTITTPKGEYTLVF